MPKHYKIQLISKYDDEPAINNYVAYATEKDKNKIWLVSIDDKPVNSMRFCSIKYDHRNKKIITEYSIDENRLYGLIKH